jgi:hypothetical protein
MSSVTQAPRLGQEKASRSKLLHHEVDIGLAGSQGVRTVVVLASREAKSHFHHGLTVLLSATSRAAVAGVDNLEALDGAVETRTEGLLVAIAGEAVVLVLYFI